MNKLKFLIATLLNLILIQNISSQELKNYKGDFDSVFGSKTTVDYQYYEDANLERIYNGKFELTAKNESTYTTQCSVSYSKNKQLIKGQYLNNKRDGYWEFSRCISDWRTDNIECYGNYIDGKKNGNWIYKFDFDINTKTFKSIYNITFKDDAIVGKLDLLGLGKEYNNHLIGIKGEIDQNGFITDAWEIHHYDKNFDKSINTNIEFYKGFLVKYTVQNNQNGTFLEKFTPNKELIIKKIDELFNNKTNISPLQNAISYKEYDNGRFGNEYGFIIFDKLDGIINSDLSKIIDPFNINLTPFEKQNSYKTEVFYYKKPKVLFRKINTDSGSKAYMPTIDQLQD